MIKAQHAFKVSGETVTVNFPNVGQLIDMESLKQLFTGGRYAIMATSNLKSMSHALDLVDAIVFFQVLCPKVKRILEIEDFLSVGLDKGSELIKIYKEEIYNPWYSNILKEVYSYGSENESAKSEG